MAWFSGIPKIGNKDTEPDESWDKITESVLEIFDKENGILPEELEEYTKKDIRKNVFSLLEDIEKNKEKLKHMDCSTNTEVLIKLLRPGRTTTLLVNKREMESLKNKYNGEIKEPYVLIKLKYMDEKGRHPNFRLFATEDYENLLEILRSFKSDSSYYKIIKEILEKIELAAFCKGGDRRARWKLDVVHSEHGEKEDCHKVAAKLTYFLLDILEDDLKKKGILNSKRNKIKVAKENCILLFNDKEKSFVKNIYPKSICPMCLEKIELIDFFRNGRNDTKSIVFGHYAFRGDRTKSVHLGKNAFWIHRTCNYIQGEYTIKKRVIFLKEILDNHKSLKIDWEERG